MSRFPEQYPFERSGLLVRKPNPIYVKIAEEAHNGKVINRDELLHILRGAGLIATTTLNQFDEYVESGRFRTATGVRLYPEKVDILGGRTSIYYDWDYSQNFPEEFSRERSNALIQAQENLWRSRRDS